MMAQPFFFWFGWLITMCKIGVFCDPVSTIRKSWCTGHKSFWSAYRSLLTQTVYVGLLCVFEGLFWVFEGQV